MHLYSYFIFAYFIVVPVNSFSPSNSQLFLPGRVVQSVAHLTQEPEVPGSIPGPATYFRFSSSADSRGAAVSYWRKYTHKVLVNCLGGLSLPKKSVVQLTDHPDMTSTVYHSKNVSCILLYHL